jgi:hypothetical protein
MNEAMQITGKHKPLIFATTIAILFSGLFLTQPAQAKPETPQNGITTSKRNSLTQQDIDKNFLETNQIIVPNALCALDKLPTIFTKTAKTKTTKTLWFPYYNPKIEKPKTYKRYKKNSTICVATYKKEYPPSPDSQQIPGQILYSFYANKNTKCVSEANSILKNDSWRSLISSPDLLGKCIVLASQVSPQEVMLLWKHPNTYAVEYDAIISINR